MRSNKMLRLALVIGIVGSIAAYAGAADNKPVDITGDTIEYDTVQGIMTVQGGVKIVQGDAVLTGQSAEYNTKAKNGRVLGGVKAVQKDATLTAQEVQVVNDTHLIALGEPVLTKGESRLTGPKIDYFSDKAYAVVEGWGKMVTPDGVLDANRIEAFFEEDRAVAQGNVHIVSQVRKLDATSDHAVYYGSKQEQGRTVLTGHARAVQEGNTLTGNVLTIYLDDKKMDAEGRSKLVVIPQS